MIVASILLFLGVVAALAGISAATRSAGEANEVTVATLLAQKHFAEVEVDTSQLSGGANSGDLPSVPSARATSASTSSRW